MVCVFSSVNIYAQLNLEYCVQKAQANYPQTQEYGLIEQARDYTISNARNAYLPQIGISARYTYQSDVTKLPSLPFEIPGYTPLKNEQYQGIAEISQLIYDGGNVRGTKKVVQASSEVEKAKLAVDLYALNERIYSLFFGIILMKEQIKQNELLNEELQRNYTKIENLKANGMANVSDLDAILVEILQNKQRKIEYETSIQGYVKVLSAFIGEDVSPTTEFEIPQAIIDLPTQIHRPELDLFSAMKTQYKEQKTLLHAKSLPVLSAFFQGGYGDPGLNMLQGEASSFYMGGIRFQWKISGFYTTIPELKKIKVEQNRIETQRETFLFNTQLAMTQQQEEIFKLQKLMEQDDEIIRLRNSIKQAAESKLEEGMLSVTDFLKEVHLEQMAIQAKTLHHIQLLVSIYNLKNTTNHE